MNKKRASRCDDDLDCDSQKVLLQLFQGHDDDGDGFIDGAELGKVLQMTGMTPTQEHIDFLLNTLDVNGDGRLSTKELASHWKTLMSHSVCGDGMMRAFKAIDTNGDGYIRLPELKALLTTRGKDPLSGTEAALLLEQLMQYDTDGDGKFCYSEFVQMYVDGMVPFGKPGASATT